MSFKQIAYIRTLTNDLLRGLPCDFNPHHPPPSQRSPQVIQLLRRIAKLHDLPQSPYPRNRHSPFLLRVGEGGGAGDGANELEPPFGAIGLIRNWGLEFGGREEVGFVFVIL